MVEIAFGKKRLETRDEDMYICNIKIDVKEAGFGNEKAQYRSTDSGFKVQCNKF
jgi:hypothetical protein